MTKVIFAGTSEFGIPALEVLKNNYDLQLIITQPDKPVGRKKILTPPPVKQWAIANGIKVIQPEKISLTENEIGEITPDIMVVASYGQIIPKKILDMPNKGSINIHSSLLPKYRGASPIQTAILNDDKETGVTIMQMDEELDHGGIYAQKKVLIDEADNYQSLHDKLAKTGAELLETTLPKILDGALKPQPQQHEIATKVTLVNRKHGKIDWTRPARQILQQIKALNPEPGTWTTLDKKSVKILKAEEARNGRVDLPGKPYIENKDLLVKCGDYSLKLTQVQPEGKNPMSGRDYLNGIKNIETKIFV
ncbi:MAG TPA: methionyl-tRNA formyltransferase [Candidatus Binatia bacterium]|nr:methionyl-tRNA formyltransferase [Candidatus Binatia bacterium]